MKVGSLFAGIGGLDLGLERAGMECAWQVEKDEYATKVLERHWPNVPRWRDIADFIADAAECTDERGKSRPVERELSGSNGRVAEVDLICGGFPCQPVSLAGRRAGEDDSRWLWESFRQVIQILRPRWVVAENVRGLLSAADAVGRRGALFGRVLRDLAELGYDAEWGLLPAAAFGAPHLRYRVFIVAYASREPAEHEVAAIGGQGREPTDAHESTDVRQGHGAALHEGDSADGRARSSTIAAGNGRNEGRAESEGQQGRPDAAECGTTAADAAEPGSQERQGQPGNARPERTATIGTDWRFIKPTIRRGDDGTANRVDRLRCLGNAVVPQVAEWIGKQILKANK